ncbi:MAG: LOG family protein [Anaerolineales bacterium]|nr:LOG family protein [Anaerolineales bacterium]
MRITVFGGSAPQPGSPAYQQAYRLGQLIGEAGHTALTGGYIGTMEAVSRGCAEAGGHVIGVTCDEIEAWRPVKPNQWVLEEIRHPSLHGRLLSLINECDAAIALPGGVGTLAEIVMMWNLMQTAAIPTRPLVLVGDGWAEMMAALYRGQDGYIPEGHRTHLILAEDVDAAFNLLVEI